MDKKRIVLGVTGASGVVYGIRLLDLLIRLEHEVHLVVSPTSEVILEYEQRVERITPANNGDTSGQQSFVVDTQYFLMNAISSIHRMFSFRTLPCDVSDSIDGENFSWIGDAIDNGKMFLYHSGDFFAKISSGSFKTDGMIVAPCSTSSMASIATGVNRHLVHRAAEVHIKERRPLILLLRETPLSVIHIDQMATLCRAGATILPASPYFYGVACGDPTGDAPFESDKIKSDMISAADLIDSIVARVLDQLKIEHPIQNRWQGRG